MPQKPIHLTWALDASARISLREVSLSTKRAKFARECCEHDATVIRCRTEQTVTDHYLGGSMLAMDEVARSRLLKGPELSHEPAARIAHATEALQFILGLTATATARGAGLAHETARRALDRLEGKGD